MQAIGYTTTLPAVPGIQPCDMERVYLMKFRPFTGLQRGSLIELDYKNERVKYEKKYTSMTPNQFKAIAFLAQYEGDYKDRSEIAEAIYGQNPPKSLRTIDTVIKQTRQRLEGVYGTSKWLTSAYGKGYVWNAAA